MNVFTAESDRALNIVCITNKVGTNGQNTNTSEPIPYPAMEEPHAQYQHPDLSAKRDDVLTAALSYAARGWQVIPLHSPSQDGCSCKSPTCHSIGKHPRTRHGLKDASTNTDQIRAWFKKWPDANVGIVTGKESGLVVLDLDDKDDEGRGSDTLYELLDGNKDAITTMMVKTGNGWHIYFRHPGGTLKNSVRQLGEGLDIRADGGYVVAAPSRHVNGEIYTIELDSEVAQLPDWLLAMIDQSKRNIHVLEVVPPHDLAGRPQIIEGYRNDELFKVACRLRGREGMEQRDLERIMLSYNETHCVPPLSVDEVLRTVASACSFPAQKSADKSLRRQNENPLWWFRFDVRNWLSDQSVNAMLDYQTGWYIRLMTFAWSKGGYLTADMSQLWRLAGAESRQRFEEECYLVLMNFELVTDFDDADVLRHKFLASEYAVTLKKWMQKISSGEERAKAKALAS